MLAVMYEKNSRWSSTIVLYLYYNSFLVTLYWTKTWLYFGIAQIQNEMVFPATNSLQSRVALTQFPQMASIFIDNKF